MDINGIMDNIFALPEASKATLKEAIHEVKYPKGYILLQANKVENTVYFIKKGIVRAYANINGADITFWFGREGETVVSMNSYVENKRGYEDIELLEDCELYKINAKALEKLYNSDIGIANWGRKFAERELIKAEERLIELQCTTAASRYKALLKNDPDLIRRVQLGHIASYLGVTQVSLSRIRSEIK